MITKNITITATVAAALTLGHCWRRSHRDDRDDEPASSVYYSGGGGSGSSSHGTSGSEASSSVTRGGFGRSGWGFGGGS